MVLESTRRMHVIFKPVLDVNVHFVMKPIPLSGDSTGTRSHTHDVSGVLLPSVWFLAGLCFFKLAQSTMEVTITAAYYLLWILLHMG